MISIEFLDLSTMVIKDNYDIWQETPKVMKDMETYFNKKYNQEEVTKAVDAIISERYGNVIEIPDDYEHKRVC